MIIGICSLCGGNVCVPEIWYSVNPPTPTCSSCGAVEESKFPVIKMTPSGTKKWTNTPLPEK